MSNTKTKKSWDVSKATRNAVVSTAEHVRILKEKTQQLTQKAEQKWVESKPHRQKAADELKKATSRAVAFGKEVQKGFKQGVTEIQKQSKKK